MPFGREGRAARMRRATDLNSELAREGCPPRVVRHATAIGDSDPGDSPVLEQL